MRGYEYDEAAGVGQSDFLRQLHSVHIAAQVDIKEINSCVCTGSDLFQQYIRVPRLQDKLHIQLLYQYSIPNNLHNRPPLRGVIFAHKDVQHMISPLSGGKLHVLHEAPAPYYCFQKNIVIRIDDFLNVGKSDSLMSALCAEPLLL